MSANAALYDNPPRFGRIGRAVRETGYPPGHAAPGENRGTGIAVAIETRRLGIRVIVIEPGFISTPILDKGIATEVGEGPYAPHLRRMQALYSNARGGAEPPSVVAELIAEALDDPSPRFRYLAGDGAAPVINGRARMTDEEWIDMGREMTDEEYWAESARRFPSD